APLVMVVNPSVPAKTVPEFITYAEANPGKITMASPGTGTQPHLAGELFKTMAGINMMQVPYRGAGPAIIDLIAGQVDVVFTAPFPVIEYIRAGKLRALAVTTTTGSEALPDVPPVGDFVPGYEASSWWGVGAPKNTPDEVVEKLNMEINAALADPQMSTRLIMQMRPSSLVCLVMFFFSAGAHDILARLFFFSMHFHDAYHDQS